MKRVALIPFIIIFTSQILFAQRETPKEKKVKFTLPKGTVINESKQIINPGTAETIAIPQPRETEKSPRSNSIVDGVIREDATDLDELMSFEEDQSVYDINDLESLKKACLVKPMEVYALRIYGDSYKSFPEEVFNFKNLRSLIVNADNVFFLPEKIHELKNLRKLVIANVAELPDSLFLLKKLEELVLSDPFAGLTEKIGELTSLKKLSLETNSIPKSIRSLKKLEELVILGPSDGGSFHYDSFENIGYLENLKILYIGYGVPNIPLSFKNLTKLEKLNVHFNRGEALNDVFSSMHYLEEVNLFSSSQNRVSISFPESFGNLEKLVTLKINSINIQNVDVCLRNLKSLESLTILESDLDVLPSSIGNSIKLKTVLLSNNQIKKLPAEINKLEDLVSLELSDNLLTALPDISNMGQLRSLLLSKNKLSQLPKSIGKNITIENLDLSYNEISYLPEEISNITYLSSLNLANNKLKKLPENVGRFLFLNYLELSNNFLESLPSSLVECRKLRILNIGNNNLTNFNLNFGKKSELYSLDISHNEIDRLSEGLGDLHTLNASNNKIKFLPQDLLDSKKITILNLSSNKLKTFEREFSGWSALTKLDLSNNSIEALKNIPLLKTRIQARPGYEQDFKITNNPISEIPKTYNEWLRKRRYGSSNAIFRIVN